jgi:GDP-L-fucose synthase
VTIRELAETIAGVVGYAGELAWDTTKPDGTPRKLLDISRISMLGWAPKIGLDDGIASTYAWYRNHAGTPAR